MSAIARWCFRHRFAVIAAWVLVLVGLGTLSQAVKSDYNNSFSLPGTGSTTAQELLAKAIPAQAGDSETIVWRVSRGTVRDPTVTVRISSMLRTVATMPEVAGVVSPYEPRGGAQISRDGRIAYATINFTKPSNNIATADITRVISAAEAVRAPGLDVELGGDAIRNTEQGSVGTSSTVGLLAAAVVLFIAFGSLLAMVLPLVTAIAGVGGGLLAIAPLTHAINVISIAPILGALIGLGVGIDYALFIVTRQRRGLQSGLTPEQAAVKAIDTSGRAVLLAGSTVCIALLGILTLGVTFLNGLAVAAALTVVFTVLAAVTLLPALLGVFGMRVLSRGQRRRLASHPLSGGHRGAPRGQFWLRWAGTVGRKPAFLAIAAAVVMLVLAIPSLSTRLGSSDAGNDPSSDTSRHAYDLLAEGFGPGFNGPLLLVAQTGNPAGVGALNRLEAQLPNVADVTKVTPLASANGTEVIQVIPGTSPEAKATSDLIAALRNDTIPAAERGTTLHVYIGGITATYADFASVVAGKMPLFLLAIIGLSFLLLVVAFRSLLIPAIAAVMNLLAAAATFGVLTAFFEWGWGTDALGLGKAGPLEAFLPAVTLAILFGLSMDYQVFLVSRMNEEWARSRDNRRAVRIGQTETGRVITAAATIMICVFLTFSFQGQRDIAEFGIGLTAAVALDAFILRTVLVPAAMHIFGDANWWLPRWLDRRLPHLAIEPPEATPIPPVPVPTALTDTKRSDHQQGSLR
ncbi:MAG TPA: MMPL family transporter [Streptosporangiaceae bacterium]|nr:MMPL family transporter [Streptosporangiaceae bacterium]